MIDRWSAVGAAVVVVLAAGVGAVAVGTTPPREPRPGPALDPGVQLSRVHDDGVTGAGVSVGVVDVTGFDADHAALAGRVAGARSFGAGGSASGNGATHGTAAAAVVARVAPDADLYLAAVEDAAGFERAVRWLVERGVDVVVAPVAAYGKPEDASGAFARAASWATTRGVVVVAPTGNLGRSHWTGSYTTSGAVGGGDGGTVAFADGGDRNYLAGGGSRVSLWLSWPRAAAGENYTVELYGERGSETWLVARSSAYGGDDAPNERLTATVDPSADHFVVVRGPGTATGTRLSLASPTHALEHRQRRGSVASPAVAEPVVAVGAYGPQSGVSVPYSAAGPLVNGRRGVDLLGPARVDAAGVPDSFRGTSAAAAYVGGVAALVVDANPSLREREVARLLAAESTDTGVGGPDPLTGYGRVNPPLSVSVARNLSG